MSDLPLGIRVLAVPMDIGIAGLFTPDAERAGIRLGGKPISGKLIAVNTRHPKSRQQLAAVHEALHAIAHATGVPFDGYTRTGKEVDPQTHLNLHRLAAFLASEGGRILRKLKTRGGVQSRSDPARIRYCRRPDEARDLQTWKGIVQTWSRYHKLPWNPDLLDKGAECIWRHHGNLRRLHDAWATQ